LGEAPEDVIAMLAAAVSPGGQRVAYRYPVGDKETVVINGKPGRTYDSIRQGPVISPGDAGHVAYVARRSGQIFVVVGDIESGPYEAVLDHAPVFSPDGKRIAFGVARDGQWFLVVADTKDLRATEARQGQTFAAISPTGVVFSPDGERIAFAARRDSGWVVVADGKETGPFDWVGQVVFHPDGEKLVYLARRDDRFAVIEEDAQARRSRGGVHDEVADVVFSPDGRRMAYWARRGNEWRVIAVQADAVRKTRQAYAGYGPGTLAFNFDGSRLTFVGIRENKAVVAANGKEYGPYDAVIEGTPVFSPDGERLTYGALRGGEWRVVVDGEERGIAYGLIKEHSVHFTPDSQKVVCVASYGNTGKSMAIAIDGELSNDYLFPLGSKLVFDGPNSFHTVTVVGDLTPSEEGKAPRLENGKFVRVDVEIHTE
jgi:Tol biopolymer transport system component